MVGCSAWSANLTYARGRRLGEHGIPSTWVGCRKLARRIYRAYRIVEGVAYWCRIIICNTSLTSALISGEGYLVD